MSSLYILLYFYLLLIYKKGIYIGFTECHTIKKIEGYMREKDIEQKLIQAVKDRCGFAVKLTSPSLNGLPDRLLLFDGGRIGFVELKASGKKPRPLQVKRIKQLQALGFKVFVVDNVTQIGDIIDEIQST